VAVSTRRRVFLASGQNGVMGSRWAIKQLAAKKGQRAKDMLVLAQHNDPFYVGSDTQLAGAEWAKKLYRLLGQKRNVHLRRLHYFALTQPGHRKPDGRIYTNTAANWKFLHDSFKFARYLGLLGYDVFIDRRNLFTSSCNPCHFKTDKPSQWCSDMADRIERLCRFHIRGIVARCLPVHIEIWVEKSTAADLLNSIADKYHINIVASMGEISLTAVWQFMKRVSDINRPVRIFYVSDFDPAGEHMPISVARKIEFILRRYKLKKKVDIKLKPLMLTRRQCRRFQLPGVPVCESSKKSFSFTRYHGRISTELHALEVARPGYIHKIVSEQLRSYLDIARINKTVRVVESSMSQTIEQITQVIKENKTLAVAVRKAENLMGQNLPLPACDHSGPWLLDSKRDYLRQLAEYHLHKLR
jgi:hypothetical protein